MGAEQENKCVRLTRGAAKKRAAASEKPLQQQPPNKKRVVLGELTNQTLDLRSDDSTNKRKIARSKKEPEKKKKSPIVQQIVEKEEEVHSDDPQMCVAYANDIYAYLHSMEVEEKRRPMCDYIEKVQKYVTSQMRGILVDWLVDVAEEYKLVPDTLYLTMSYLDRYLSSNALNRQRLQLLGVSCMLIASKYEEISPPHVEDFCYITDNTYTKQEVVFYVFDPALGFANLAKTISLQSLVTLMDGHPSHKSPIPFQGSHLGLLFGREFREHASHYKLIPAVCKEKGSPFGDKDVCHDNGMAYASLSLAAGTICIWSDVYNVIRISSSKSIREAELNGSTSVVTDKIISISPNYSEEDKIPSQSQEPVAFNCKQQMKVFARKMNLKKLVAPSTIAAIIALIVGVIAPVRRFVIGENAPLHVIHDSASLLGDGAIPTVSLVMGGNLTKELNREDSQRYLGEMKRALESRSNSPYPSKSSSQSVASLEKVLNGKQSYNSPVTQAAYDNTLPQQVMSSAYPGMGLQGQTQYGYGHGRQYGSYGTPDHNQGSTSEGRSPVSMGRTGYGGVISYGEPYSESRSSLLASGPVPYQSHGEVQSYSRPHSELSSTYGSNYGSPRTPYSSDYGSLRTSNPYSSPGYPQSASREPVFNPQFEQSSAFGSPVGSARSPLSYSSPGYSRFDPPIPREPAVDPYSAKSGAFASSFGRSSTLLPYNHPGELYPSSHDLEMPSPIAEQGLSEVKKMFLMAPH